MTTDELFQNELGLAHFHDAVLDATDKSYSDQELRDIYDKLPGHILEIAEEWGLSDTVFRDEVVSHLRAQEKQ